MECQEYSLVQGSFKIQAKWLTPKKLNITEAFFFNIWDIFLHF